MTARAYYNEFDGFAAQWLRNLIAAGHIAAGDVDERDIQDVRADDLRGYTQAHFFAGIGGWSLAARLAGWPDDRSLWTGSCPCQPFSAAGKRRGVEDERHLWPVFRDLVALSRPSVVFGEQVASKAGRAWLAAVRADLEALGYAVGAADVCAAGVGAPHIRQRLWFVASARGEGWRQVGADARGSGEGGKASRLDERSLHGGAGVVAHHHHHGREGLAGAGVRRPEVHDADGRGAERLAHGEREGLEVVGEQQARGQRATAERCGAAGELEKPQSDRRDGALLPGERKKVPRSVGAGAAGELADASCGGDENRNDSDGSTGQHVRDVAGGSGGSCGRDRAARSGEPAAGNAGSPGFWAAVDWLPCRDGKARPVEPGTCPLAHGVPGRVGRLRAYGNAIVPQVAAEVIAAFMECAP